LSASCSSSCGQYVGPDGARGAFDVVLVDERGRGDTPPLFEGVGRVRQRGAETGVDNRGCGAIA